MFRVVDEVLWRQSLLTSTSYAFVLNPRYQDASGKLNTGHQRPRFIFQTVISEKKSRDRGTVAVFFLTVYTLKCSLYVRRTLQTATWMLILFKNPLNSQIHWPMVHFILSKKKALFQVFLSKYNKSKQMTVLRLNLNIIRKVIRHSPTTWIFPDSLHID